MALTLKRTRAGHYEGRHSDGSLLEVEYVDFRGVADNGYGDYGWLWWVDGERSDFPVATKCYAVQLLEDYLQKHHDEAKAEVQRNIAAQRHRCNPTGMLAYRVVAP